MAAPAAAGEPGAPAVLPSFPLPPPFFKLYADDDGTGSRPLPPEPPQLPEGSFMVFGQPFDPVRAHAITMQHMPHTATHSPAAACIRKLQQLKPL